MNNQVPKRKFVNAYQLFLTEQIKILPTDQKRKRGDQFKIIGKKWKELSTEEKHHYQELFRQAEREFQQILGKFNSGDQTTLNEDVKKPPAVYFLFAREKKLELQQLYPSKNYAEIRSMISKEYKNLTKEQREPYEIWRKTLMDKYLQEQEKSKGQLTYHVKRRSVSKISKIVDKTPQILSNKKPKIIKKSKSAKALEQQNQDQSFQSKSSKSITKRKQEEKCNETEKIDKKHQPKIRVNFKKKNEIIIK